MPTTPSARLKPQILPPKTQRVLVLNVPIHWLQEVAGLVVGAKPPRRRAGAAEVKVMSCASHGGMRDGAGEIWGGAKMGGISFWGLRGERNGQDEKRGGVRDGRMKSEEGSEMDGKTPYLNRNLNRGLMGVGKARRI